MTYVMTNLARSADSNDNNRALAFRSSALRLRKTCLAELRQSMQVFAANRLRGVVVYASSSLRPAAAFFACSQPSNPPPS